MPARDRYHDCVKNALVKDGWTITHDPLYVQAGNKDMYVDLGAEQLLTADKEGRKIAVEIKGFLSESDMKDLHEALGQFMVYQSALRRQEPDRTLYLAVPFHAKHDLFEEPIGLMLLEDYGLRLLVFAPETESIIQWMPPAITTAGSS
jgi:hypothetical protein